MSKQRDMSRDVGGQCGTRSQGKQKSTNLKDLGKQPSPKRSLTSDNLRLPKGFQCRALLPSTIPCYSTWMNQDQNMLAHVSKRNPRGPERGWSSQFLLDGTFSRDRLKPIPEHKILKGSLHVLLDKWQGPLEHGRSQDQISELFNLCLC